MAAALCLTAFNLSEASRAASFSETVLLDMNIVTLPSQETPAIEDTSIPSDSESVYIINSEIDMPTITVNGNEYIGVLEIPALGLSLPVISKWSYPNLRLAPCRYKGSAYLDDLIIAAHNYKQHFGLLKDLNTGDEIKFIDVDSNCFTYKVFEVEQLAGTDREEMEAGDWDLTLFTCTIGGQARITVRCERMGDDYSR